MKSFLVLLAVFSLACTPINEKKATTNTPIENANYGDKKAISLASEALQFCKQKGYNEQFCIFVDMGLPSGNQRFFVWDFGQNKSTDKAMVSHGCGKGAWANDGSRANPVFSNTPESHCSSYGKYKIGERGYSQWGINVKYLLHGLDSTNSNALKRNIVLHSWEHVPDQETYPKGIAESWGCPAVSNYFMKHLDAILKRTDKPVLLWMLP
jgi:hypothetical protein